MPATAPRRQKLTFAGLRASGVRGLLIYCADYPTRMDSCGHAATASAASGARVKSRAAQFVGTSIAETESWWTGKALAMAALYGAYWG
jgi:hypothetical protein